MTINNQLDFEEISSCLKCSADLKIKNDKIECEKCHHSYPFIKGIARFVDSEGYSSSFGYQWNIHIKTQIDKYNGTSISHDRFYSQSQWSGEELCGRRVLECGSGAGRFTQILCEAKAKIFSIDFSRAVEANQSNNKEYNNLFISQASIYELPYKKNTFDYLVCLGVIQHTPDVKETVRAMLEYLKEDGKFCIDVYAFPHSYLHPRHILRPFTKKMETEKLYKCVERMVDILLPLSTLLHKVPVVGQYLARLVPVANWRANIKLANEAKYKEWSVLDTFDWLSPEFEQPQSQRTLRCWFKEFGVKEFKIKRFRGLYVISGVK